MKITRFDVNLITIDHDLLSMTFVVAEMSYALSLSESASYPLSYKR